MSYNDLFVYVWISLFLHLHEINVSKWTMLWLLIQTFSVTNVTPNIWSTVTGLNIIGWDPSTSNFRSITYNSNVQYFSKAGMKEKFAIFNNYQTLLLLSKCCFTSLVHMSCPSLLSLATISKTSLFCGTFQLRMAGFWAILPLQWLCGYLKKGDLNTLCTYLTTALRLSSWYQH